MTHLPARRPRPCSLFQMADLRVVRFDPYRLEVVDVVEPFDFSQFGSLVNFVIASTCRCLKRAST